MILVKTILTKLVKPIAESTNDLGPVRIEQQGSTLIDNTRRERLQSFADKLILFLRAQKNGEVTSASASKYLRQDPILLLLCGTLQALVPL